MRDSASGEGIIHRHGHDDSRFVFLSFIEHILFGSAGSS